MASAPEQQQQHEQEEAQALSDSPFAIAEALAHLPLADQLTFLQQRLDDGASPDVLLLAAARLVDHEPCAWLLERLLSQGKLASPAVESALLQLLCDSADTFVQRLLTSLREMTLDGDVRAVAERTVSAALDRSPLSRLTAICLLERWLAVFAPEASLQRREQAVRRCAQAITEALPSALPPRLLLDLPGAQLPSLHALAVQHGVPARWQEMLQAMAREVLGTLAGLPRTLSQANAEQLLAHEVYEAPGHFLSELIQNADDAGARIVRLEIDPREVRFSHDGAPFDARDVVGVLSIGLGTKRRGQIGRFGVGFKSVHQVTDRPQVYSGPFALEIMRVSLPRALTAPPGLDPALTRLVLPLRVGVSADVLARLAAEIPASTLLALRHVRSLHIEDSSLAVSASVAPAAPGQLVLTRSGDQARTLLVEREDDGVMVAVALEGGLAAPLPEGQPSVYCFLPTAEATGLRFMLHAPFDVPLDRERIERESPRNLVLLRRAGELLASLVHRAASAGASGPQLRSLLGILPLPEDLSHPAYRAVCEGLAQSARTLALLPSAAGFVAPPSRLAIAFDAALCEVLAGVVLDEQGTTLLAPLAPRETRVARLLGASPLSPDALVGWLARVLADAAPGELCTSSWLPRAFLPIATALGKAPPGAFALLPLTRLPWLVDQHGRLTAPSSLRLAQGQLRALYSPLASMLDEAAERSLEPDAARLLCSLGARPIIADELLGDLRAPAFAHALLSAHGDGLLVAYLATLSPSQKRLASTLPVFPDDAGALGPLVGDAGTARVWLAPDGSLGAFLRALPSSRPALISAQLSASHRAELLALGAQIFSLTELLSSLASGALTLSASEAIALLVLLDAERDELAPRLRQAIGRARVFPDASGKLRPLWGEGGVAITDEPEIARLFADVPWLDAQVAQLPLVQAMAPRRVGLVDVARALLGESAAPLVLPDGAGREALVLLARSSERLDPALSARLRRAPLFPSSQGLTCADELRLAPVDARLVRLYAGSPSARPLLDDAELITAARALGAEVSPVDVRDLIGDLQAMRVRVDADEQRDDLATLLVEAAHLLSPSQIEPLLSLPLFGVHGGGRDRIARWGSGEPGARRAKGVLLDALAGGPFALLSEGDELRFGALLSALGVRTAGVEDLLSSLDTPWGALAPSRDRVRAALASLADELPPSPGLSARIEALPLFRSRTGAFCSASQALLSPALATLSATADVSLPWLSSMLQARLLDAESASDAVRLSGVLRFAPVGEALAGALGEQLASGVHIEQQPDFARSPEQLASLGRVLRGLIDHSVRLAIPLGLDANHRLAPGVLQIVSSDELVLCRALSLAERLADPSWAALSAEPDRLSPLPAFRLTEAALAMSRGPSPTAFEQPEVRARLYAFVLARASEIEREARAWGPLGQARFVAATGGQLLSPRQLLLDDALPDLPLDGRPLDEVPGELRAFFARVYGLEEPGRRRLAQALAELLDELGSRDGARAVLILGVLARTLGVAASSRSSRENEAFAEGVARSLKLAKRVRVETSQGSLRPRELRLLDETSLALVARFHPQPPARLASQEGLSEIGPLLRILGAADDLSAEELAPFLSGASPLLAQPGARLALATYVALAAVRLPALRQSLALDKAAWVPSAAGSWHAPSALFWPEPGLEALLGEAPSLVPHPEFALTAPERLGRWLPFRHLDDVTPQLVAEALATDAPAPLLVLQWLERGLSQGKLVAAEVRRSLADKLLLVDDVGRVVPASRLRPVGDALDGDARAVWPESPSFPRLCAALRLGERIAPRLVAVPAPAEAPAKEGPRKRSPRPAATQPEDAAPPDESDGLAARLKRWWSGKSEPALPAQELPRGAAPVIESEARSRPAASPRQIEQRSWFAGERALEAQLGNGVTFDEQRTARAEFGFAASPAKLPAPYVYAPRDVFGRFDVSSQRWLPVRLPPLLRAPGDEALARVRLTGRLPAGTAYLPVPLYAALTSCEAGRARAFAARDGSMKLVLDAPSDVAIELWLRQAPRFSDEPVDLAHDEALLSSCVDDAELPAEVLSLVDGLRASALSPLARALRVRDFIRERYRYEPSYLEDPAVGRALSRLARGSSNEHLAALHAARDAKHLGAGVCYELNTLACELLRRAGVPAVVCTGWVLDGGQVTAPDHLWAMALVGSDLGPRLLPIDAASTVDGRPIRARQRPDGAFKPERAEPITLPAEPAWALRQPTRDRSSRKVTPTIELSRVVRFLEQAAGERPLDEGTLRRRLRAVLDDPEEMRRLLALLRG